MTLMLISLLVAGAAAAADDTLADLSGTIKSPGKAYTSGPLWVWNDLLTDEQVRHTLGVLADQHVLQAWVHPRPGLMTPYMSEEWLARWETALETARERDMLIWIYDENSYPSGFAGGMVPEAMPESRAIGVSLKPGKHTPVWNDRILAVHKKTAKGYEDITKQVKKGKDFPEGDYVVARIEEAKTSPWYGGKYHTDLLLPGVTEKFLEVTLEPYRKRFGDEFGKRIPGVFTDEPHLKACGDIHWTPDLEKQFKKRWHYDILELLPALRDDTADGMRLRHNYFQLMNELFIERWAKPYYEYCGKNNLEFTGHYWEHEWPNCASVPDNMAMAAWQHRPGIDILFNQYREDVRAQFGNVRSVVELASVANQTGRARTLCEVYGGSGAEMTFADYKRIGDWIQVLGVNTPNEHLSDVTLRGARKRDYPPTFSYHSPWMAEYHVLADYFTRVSHALSRGKQINPCLVLEPTTTAWMHHFTGTEKMKTLGDTFQSLVVALAKAQVEFDLGSESIIRERGAVAQAADGKAAFRVGERDYTVVVVPEGTENLNRETLELLKAYLDKGGLVLSCAGPELPSHVDGRAGDECAALRASANWRQIASGAAAEQITAAVNPALRVVPAPDNKGIVYHHRRQLADGEILFITNTSNDVPASGSVLTAAKGVRVVNLNTGEIHAGPALADGAFPFTLPPCGSVLLLLDREPVAAAPAATPAGERQPVAVSDITARRLDDNNLILDYVDVSAGGETASGMFWQRAADLTFKKNGLRGNIWDHAVQFRDELLKTPFAPDSGFTATYRFTIEGAVPERLFAVVERPDIYTVDCNGTPLAAPAGEWWLDRAFGRMDISKCARVGENTLTITARPMNVFHELEAAHIVGDFSLKPAAKGFVIIPSAPLGLGEWKAQGLPLYGHRVAYTATVTAAPGGRHVLALPAWKGVVAKVLVNGADAGHVCAPPMECDITEKLKPGENTVEVVVYGSLRNTLGPHLGDNSTGLTHPGSWGKAPETGQPAGADYFSMGYGLEKPFEVWHLAG